MARSPFEAFLVTSFVVALATFVLLFFVAAPCGRHARKGWGPTLDTRLGWLLMEAPAALTMLVCFAVGTRERTVTLLALLALWELHYIYRAFIYPFRLRGDHRGIPFTIPLMGMVFSLWNGCLNGHHLFTLSDRYTAVWMRDPRFVLGAGSFLGGC